MPGESGKGDVDGHRFDVDRHHFLRYHLLGVLCWLYPVGYPRIYIHILICECVRIKTFHVSHVCACITYITPWRAP